MGTKDLVPIENHKYFKGSDKIKRISDENGQIVVNLNFQDPENNFEKRSATLTYTFPQALDLKDKLIFTKATLRGNIVGKGHQRSRMAMEIIDIKGKKLRGPRIPFPESNPQIYLGARITSNEPIPLGSVQIGFDPTQIKKIILRFIIARNDAIRLPAHGKIYIDPVQAIDSKNLTSIFGAPDSNRITRNNLPLGYRINKLRWENEYKDRKFFVGINYPWGNYGWDVGKNPWGSPENSGWSSREEKLREDFTYLKLVGFDLVRIYLLCDLRTGLEYTNNNLTGFDKYVRPDTETLIRVAGEVGVMLDLVWFDFGIADGISQITKRNGKEIKIGEHPELIFSSKDKFNFLKNLMIPLFRDVEKWNNMYGRPIYAIELMNEPENMVALIMPEYYQSLKTWFQDLTNIIHNETSLKVTLGSASIVDMQRFWNDVQIDIWQFHFYKYMLAEHEQWPQTLKREGIKFPGIIFAGEFDPYDIEANINMIKDQGYDGIAFWSFNANDGHMLKDSPELKAISEWIKKFKETQSKETP